MDRDELYAHLALASRGLRGGWWARLGQAETRRWNRQLILKPLGLWSRCASLPWLSSWAPGGEIHAPLLDDLTLAWHAEKGGAAWLVEQRRRQTYWGSRLAWFRVMAAWALEAPFALLSFRLQGR